MVSIYAAHDIGFRKRTGIKDNGTPIFEPVRSLPHATIKGRFEYSRRLIRDANGEQVISEAYIMTEHQVELGDLIVWDRREWPALSVTNITGVLGNELYRVVSL